MWLKQHVEKSVKDFFGSPIYSKIVSDWSLIVGEQLKDKATPIHIRFPKGKSNNGTLSLEVLNPCYGLEVQMMTKTILEKISIYFGYKAISKIKIVIANDKLCDETSDDNVPLQEETKLSTEEMQDIINVINQNKNDKIKKILINIAKQLRH